MKHYTGSPAQPSPAQPSPARLLRYSNISGADEGATPEGVGCTLTKPGFGLSAVPCESVSLRRWLIVSEMYAWCVEKGELIAADEAEFRLIDEMRKMGQASGAWAEQQMKKEAQAQLVQKGTRKHSKKLSWHTTFGDITLEEPQLRQGNQGIRPFAHSAHITHRGCSPGTRTHGV